MREEFWRRLCDILPLSKAKKLIEVINESWTDGMTKRTKSAEILTLKASIRDFVTAKARQGEIYVDELLPDKINPFLNITEVGAIIELTQNLTDLLIQGYLDSFSSDPFTPSSNDLWLHRGLHLITLFKDGVYREQNYISSYTLSISVSEKFAQCISGKKPVIISAPLNNFYNRFLFFSELIPDLDLKQFEFAVVPHWMRINLKYLGEFFGIHEYELD
jgi:hypothetical protein